MPRYADLIERTLFNVIATSPSPTGTAFYYANTLHQRAPGRRGRRRRVSPRAPSSLRAPWFDVSCCPPNVARTLASLAGYLATADDAGIQLHQYAPASIRTTLADGQRVALDVETDYPRDGCGAGSHAHGCRGAVDALAARPGVGGGRAARPAAARAATPPSRRPSAASRA